MSPRAGPLSDEAGVLDEVDDVPEAPQAAQAVSSFAAALPCPCTCQARVWIAWFGSSAPVCVRTHLSGAEGAHVAAAQGLAVEAAGARAHGLFHHEEL